MKIPLYTLVEAYQDEPNPPAILLTVTLADLHQFMVDTIDHEMERIRPLWVQPEPDKQLTRKEVAEMLKVCETTVHNLVKDGKLNKIKIGSAVRYSQREVQEYIDSQKQ